MVKDAFKAWCPDVVLKLLRGVQSFHGHRLYKPSHLSVWIGDVLDEGTGELATPTSREACLQALLKWLSAAQDVTGNGGVAAFYGLREGWSAAYPETTGYIICTVLEAAKRFSDDTLQERARSMADWELSIQMPEGAWESGHGMVNPIPAVFNTGQIIQGLVSAYRDFRDERYLQSAKKGGDWLLSIQDGDGAWRKHTYRNFPNTYSTRVAWPLLELAEVTGDTKYADSSTKYLEWARSCQDPEGWFRNCTLEPGEPPLTHTLGYTIEGFLESGVLVGNNEWIQSAQLAGEQLLKKFEVRKMLAGAYDKGWKGDHSFMCLTGSAQMSRNWSRLYGLTGDVRFLNGALKLNDLLVSHLYLHTRNPGIFGGVKGSHPIWGHYMPARFPSWAAKFTLDAFFEEERAITQLQSQHGTSFPADE